MSWRTTKVDWCVLWWMIHSSHAVVHPAPPVAQIELDLNWITCRNYVGPPLAIERGSLLMTQFINHYRYRTNRCQMDNVCSTHLHMIDLFWCLHLKNIRHLTFKSAWFLQPFILQRLRIWMKKHIKYESRYFSFFKGGVRKGRNCFH